MKTSTIDFSFKVIHYLFYIGLCIGCLFFVRETWIHYQSGATSFIISTNYAPSIKCPTIVICFDPYAKRSYFKENVTNSVELQREASYRVGYDFDIIAELLDEHQNIHSLIIRSTEESHELIQVTEIFSLYSGLCTKINIKADLVDDHANVIEIKFNQTIHDSDLPQVKTYFTSEENSGKGLHFFKRYIMKMQNC